MIERIKRRPHGGDVWKFSREHKVPLEEIIDFSAPINPFGAPPMAIEAIKNFSQIIKFYPDRDPKELKESIANYIGGVTADNVVLGNGSVELIYAFIELFAKKQEVAIIVPSFTEYEGAVLRSGSKPIHVRLAEDFSIDAKVVKEAICGEVKMLVICNPNSPSGRVFKKDLILDIVEYCREKSVMVLVDENYMDFIDPSWDYSVSQQVNEFDNLFVVGSFSKFFGMPGLRIGYGIGRPELVQNIEDHLIPWNINALSIVAAKAALNDKDFIEKTKSYIKMEREKLVEMLKQIKALKVYPSATNFLLIRILSDGVNARMLQEKLAKEKILIRTCEDFHGLNDKYFRISIRKPEENRILVEALKRILE
ncbi:MAG: threonine-phosphate decarboxylase CobD [Candidatus Bathyarchaeia archaeon]